MRVPENYEPHPLITAPRPAPIDLNDAYVQQLIRHARPELPTAVAVPLPRGATVSGGLGPNRVLGA